MALGITATAGLILMLVGAFGMIQGLVGLIDNEIYVVTNKWLFELNPIVWGWGHIVIGLIALCAGIGLFLGKVRAQVTAIIVAAFSILANFAWRPHSPVWALLVITFDVFVIWAVTATATTSAPPDLPTRGDGCEAARVMTLSEYERRTLDGIETGCRADDPGLAARLDLAAAKHRRRREWCCPGAQSGWAG
jgi:hypothetical protein